MTHTATTQAQFLRLPEVMSRTGLGKSTIWNRAASGTFPKQVKLGPRTSAWSDVEVARWIADRITERDAIAV